MSCGFQGNSDIFGVGIRAGYYSQILAIWFSNCFYTREAKTLRAVNNLFLVALIVAGFIYIFNATGTYAIEVFLLLQIGLIVGLFGITEFIKYSTAFRAVSKERLILRILIMLFGGFFNLLFWWTGLDYLLPTPCDNTEGLSATYAFYFWKTNVYGWMRTLMKIQSVFAAAFAVPSQVSYDVAALMYDVHLKKARSAFVDAVHTLLSKDDSASMFRSSLLMSYSQGTQMMTDEHTVDARNHKIAILLKVSEAEDYLASIYSIYEQIPASPKATKSNFQLFKRFWTPGWLLKDCELQERCTDTTPYLKSLLKSRYNILINRPPYNLWTTLYLHETAATNRGTWKSPRLINRMASVNAARDSPIDWRIFRIASDIALSQVPASQKRNQKRNVWVKNAVAQFWYIGFLVLQVECTIIWNNVYGLQSVSNLGQLIPLIIGVGGLVKVIWGKARMLYEGEDEAGLETQSPSEYEMAMARYIDSKGQTDRPSLPVRAATA